MGAMKLSLDLLFTCWPSGIASTEHTHTRHTYKDLLRQAVSRNQAHADLWPACTYTWFNKVQ